jgi:hypothetical protein
MLCEQPRRRRKYAALLGERSSPVIRIKSMRVLRPYYRHWQLSAAL